MDAHGLIDETRTKVWPKQSSMVQPLQNGFFQFENGRPKTFVWEKAWKVIHASATALPFFQSETLKYQQHDLEGAREDFQQALAYQPDLTPALFNLGVIWRDQEHNDEAKTIFQQVFQRGELLADASKSLGILAARAESYFEAETYYRKAIEAKATFPLAHFNLSNVLLRRES